MQRGGRIAPVGEAFLDAWRAAVKRDTYGTYAAQGILREQLPLFAAGRPVVFEAITFFVTDNQCRVAGTDNPVGTPDIDKLLRSTLDALSTGKVTSRFRGARLYADDSQVVSINKLSKQRAAVAGALIVVREWESNATV